MTGGNHRDTSGAGAGVGASGRANGPAWPNMSRSTTAAKATLSTISVSPTGFRGL
ncbi:hypothetical protein [Actinoallomurus acaciae]|uniref:Uncharacterized protein n=1 Tax=Actinoallomurus acaciae TaxID=502577 RepID=A0ABV5YK74_9ACTN